MVLMISNESCCALVVSLPIRPECISEKPFKDCLAQDPQPKHNIDIQHLCATAFWNFWLKVPSLWPSWPNSMHPCWCLYVMGWAQNCYVTAPKSNWGKLTWPSQNEASHTDWLLWWGKILWHISNSKAFLLTKMMVGAMINVLLIILQSKAPNVSVSIIWWTFVCI